MLNKIYSLFLISILLIVQSCVEPKITAELKYVVSKEDSLIISVNLQNHSNKPLFLVCKVNEIDIEEINTILENYGGSVEEEFEYLKNKAWTFVKHINEQSSIKDTIRLTLPKVEKRFQANHIGDKVDVYDRINNLQEAYYILRRNKLAPDPPNVNDISEIFYTDIDVYNLKILENINDEETLFFQDVVILKPDERKTFFIDVSYLLLQKATYRLSFNYQTDDTIFLEEGEILQKLGFKRFDGHIISNEIEIKSIAGAIL